MKRKLVGWLCLILGALGTALPIVPGIIFFMMAVVLLKDSSTLVRWAWYQCQVRIPKFKELSDAAMPKVEEWLKKLKL